MDEREVMSIEIAGTQLSGTLVNGVFYKICYTLKGKAHTLRLFAKDELHAYQRFEELEREGVVSDFPFGTEQVRKRKQKKG